MDYKVIIEVWPHSTGRGAVVDKAEIWPRVREFIIEADNFRDAFEIAEYMRLASQSHHKVWHANLRTITTWPMMIAAMNEAEKPPEAKP